MRRLLIALSLAAAAETAAIACSCMAPATVEEARPLACETVRAAVAIVEADVVSGYDHSARRGERVRVRRTLWGEAPAAFEVHRAGPVNSAMCGMELGAGQRRVLILYPVRNAAPWRGPRFAVQNLCTDIVVRNPRFLRLTLEEARRRG